VQKAWANRGIYTRTPLHTRIYEDVWQLLHEHAGPLRRFLEKCPIGVLLLIAAGSPCQQLTAAGKHRGKQGLCGRDSNLFYAVPAVAYASQVYRPDLAAHVLLEDAGSVQEAHKRAVLVALGLPANAPPRVYRADDPRDLLTSTTERVRQEVEHALPDPEAKQVWRSICAGRDMTRR